ncbi:MAG: phosphodiesterase, partial [Clostridiales bacterium]|nr:phosphodiesterase [Clostridiales bacterium]
MGLAFDIGLFSNLIDVFSRNQKAIVEQSRELEASNDRVMKLAYFDELTGLPNRNKLFEWLETTVQNNVAGKLAVYLIDIRNFSNTNGYFGYEKGDEFLISIANRLNQFRSRGSILARIEGVRLVYARTISGYEDPGGLAERFIEAFQSPVETGNLSYRFDLNIGVCVYPDHGDSFRDILKNSGIALTYAKRKPNMRYEVFSSKLLEYTEKRRIMEMDLSVAIWNNELRLVYQPQYDLKRESIRGFEALLRWRSKDYGEISPGEFIPIAEEAGLIIQIGEWVIRKVAEKALEIKHKYNLGITFCINISPIQLMNKGFLALLEELAATSPDVRSLLEFEITEGIMVAYDEGIDVFNRAKELGYSLALDDFGTGYSSLSYLKRLPIDILKIDRSFIMELEEKSGNFGITDNIIDIGHKMNFEVIAEGVETEEQLNILRQCGCDYIQGYYYARPMEEVKLEGYIEDQLYDRYRVKGKETGKGAADKPMV